MPEFCGATLDSRLVKPGMLFVAVRGERVDGHDFIPQALAAGAAGIVDGREELARVAAEYRRTLKAKVIGITGSAGKTTTKELVAAFLRAGGFRVSSTARRTRSSSSSRWARTIPARSPTSWTSRAPTRA